MPCPLLSVRHPKRREQCRASVLRASLEADRTEHPAHPEGALASPHGALDRLPRVPEQGEAARRRALRRRSCGQIGRARDAGVDADLHEHLVHWRRARPRRCLHWIGRTYQRDHEGAVVCLFGRPHPCHPASHHRRCRGRPLLCGPRRRVAPHLRRSPRHPGDRLLGLGGAAARAERGARRTLPQRSRAACYEAVWSGPSSHAQAAYQGARAGMDHHAGPRIVGPQRGQRRAHHPPPPLRRTACDGECWQLGQRGAPGGRFGGRRSPHGSRGTGRLAPPLRRACESDQRSFGPRQACFRRSLDRPLLHSDEAGHGANAAGHPSRDPSGGPRRRGPRCPCYGYGCFEQHREQGQQGGPKLLLERHQNYHPRPHLQAWNADCGRGQTVAGPVRPQRP
mmetsp:Transcript_55251/g.117840  ORF Transcript_55251/g.117840 Transcript_55251/m.117840 type:complete len:395 (+) Transcript_55251:1371-2555(+)